VKRVQPSHKNVSLQFTGGIQPPAALSTVTRVT